MNAIRGRLQNPAAERAADIERVDGPDRRGDETYNVAAAESSAKALLDAMTPADKEIAYLLITGYTYSEMAERGHSNEAVSNARKRIKQLRRLLPDLEGVRLIARTMPPASRTTLTTNYRRSMCTRAARLRAARRQGLPTVLEMLLLRGLHARGQARHGMEIEDLEVREAVKNTRRASIEIAQQVRSGL